MKRRKEETEEEDRETIIQSKLIPLDLIPNIFSRLPAKSALRFRCVSKLCSSITTRPDFITLFATHHSKIRPCLLVSIKTEHNNFFFSLPQNEDPHSTSSYSLVDRCHTNFTKFDFYTPESQSVHGLICFGHVDRIVVWNPTMRQHVTLPKPIVKFISCRLGYDPVEDKYKVLCIYKHQDPLVFTLGSQESWRVATQNSPLHFHKCTMGGIGTCINGHLYYQARIRVLVDEAFEDEEIIMSFDVRYEKFNVIKRPTDPKILNMMLNYKGKLACVCSDDSSIRLWVLEDEEKEEWSTINFVLPFPSFPQSHDPIWEVMLVFRGVTHDTSEFIFIAPSVKPMNVLYYDPKRNQSRRVIYKGIGDEEFKERNGIDSTVYNIQWYPNHYESLMSLENVKSHIGS